MVVGSAVVISDHVAHKSPVSDQSCVPGCRGVGEIKTPARSVMVERTISATRRRAKPETEQEWRDGADQSAASIADDLITGESTSYLSCSASDTTTRDFLP